MGKSGFANQEAMVRHMSQPRSSCSGWSNNLICLQEELLSTLAYLTQQDTSNSMVADKDARNPQEFYNSEAEGAFEHASVPTDTPQPNVPMFTVQFQGAANSFKDSTTFLNKFDIDKFNNH
ncbi:hypothetical protein JVU11DRAFT_11766 [Chiua virens]|nr:hypothetical protein JVU11DRAFT_11766 [Chiua virens]